MMRRRKSTSQLSGNYFRQSQEMIETIVNDLRNQGRTKEVATLMATEILVDIKPRRIKDFVHCEANYSSYEEYLLIRAGYVRHLRSVTQYYFAKYQEKLAESQAISHEENEYAMALFRSRHALVRSR